MIAIKYNLLSFNDVLQTSKGLKDNKLEGLNESRFEIKSNLLQIRQPYRVNYRRQTIGTIEEGIDCWLATAGLKFGAFEKKLETKRKAKGWLLNNYLKVVEAKIEFSVSENLCHYTIESGYWLIKIDVREEDSVATIQDRNDLLFEYFPTLNDAIAMGFDLILNSDRSIDYSCDEEF